MTITAMAKRFLAAFLVLGLLITLTASLGLAQGGVPGWQLVKSGTTLKLTLEAKSYKGLKARDEEGKTYLVLMPVDLTLGKISSFYEKYKGQQVSLTGDLFRDRKGKLNLAVPALPE